MTTTLEHVPVGKIKPAPDQPRKTFDAAEHADLVESVRMHGVMAPIALRRNGSGDAFVIISGERRWRAATDAGLKEIPAQIFDGGSDSFTVEALVENLVREDLAVIDEGDSYLRLLDRGLTVEAIAKAVSRPLDRVRDRVSLARLPEPARAAVTAGSVSLRDVRQYIDVCEAAPELGYVLTTVAAVTGTWNGPWMTFLNLDRVDPTVQTRRCPDCDGTGDASDNGEDEWERCKTCKGEGDVTEKVKGAKPLPPFFAWALRHATPLEDLMVAQLTADAKKRVKAAKKKAADHYAEKKKAASSEYSYVAPFNGASFDDQAIVDAAVAAGVVVSFGSRNLVVTDPAFVSEYLPDAYEAAADAYVSNRRDSSGRSAAKGPLTPEQERLRAERTKQRGKDAAARAEARSVNSTLGIAIQTKLGEVPVTTEAVRLMVQTILDLSKQTGYGQALAGEGHALYHRFLSQDWPATKAGDWKVPRSAEDRKAFVDAVYKQAEKDLAAAKKPEQAFAVLVRFMAAGLVDLRGLPNADLAKMHAFRAQRDGWRAFVLARLPKPIRDRVPAANGVKGSSHAW